MDSIVVEQIAAYSTPIRLPVQGDDRREQRNWVIRLLADLPDEWNPDNTSALLNKEAASAVRKRRAASSTTDEPVGIQEPPAAHGWDRRSERRRKQR
jgi:hypothetical protein